MATAALLLLLSSAAASSLRVAPAPAHAHAAATRVAAVHMMSSFNNADEEEARRRWLEARADNNNNHAAASDAQQRMSPEDAMMARQREREEARKRMLAHSAPADFLGYGTVDDTNYGYGPQEDFRRPQRDDDDGGGQGNFWPEWLTADPVGAAEAAARTRDASGGFDGRHEGWGRKVEQVDPNPPPMPNTLRGPGESSVPAQSYLYDFEPQVMDPAVVQRLEEEAARKRADKMRQAEQQVWELGDGQIDDFESDLLDKLRRAKGTDGLD